MSNKLASLYSNDFAINKLDLYMTTCNDVNMELALVHVGAVNIINQYDLLK